MRQRTRKLIGTFLLLGWVTFYALVVMAIMAGVAWIPVAMLVIWWMARPDPEADEA
ncbi:MAG: hypothetical protein FD152_2568 [Xanthobacteraceae bacterium]|nr:MAG: hypothetical protein FD152_2568 [Xanthobacteraceae bacterium]